MLKLGLFGGVLTAALGVAPLLSAHGPAHTPTLTTLVSFDPAASALPESITADERGNLYNSLITGAIVRTRPGGASTVVATIPLPTGALAAGIKVGPDGFLYVASGSLSADPPGAFVWKVSAKTGSVSVFATLPAEGFPNDLAFDDRGNLYVTDTFLGIVWKLDQRGTPSVFLDDPLLDGNPDEPALGFHTLGVNGIAFDEKEKNLYVSNLDFGTVFRVPLGKRRKPELQLFAVDERLKGIDGIAFDAKGTLYGIIDSQNSIATIDRHGDVSLLVSGAPLDGPSSLVFGTGRFDQRTLYVTNFSLLSGAAGTPSILSLPVKVGGLPLP
jgi:sugar lactone lactonase YvrE